MSEARSSTARLARNELRALAAHGVVKAYSRNAVIACEGDDTDSFYVIISGRVKVYAHW